MDCPSVGIVLHNRNCMHFISEVFSKDAHGFNVMESHLCLHQTSGADDVVRRFTQRVNRRRVMLLGALCHYIILNYAYIN